jgi:hypothetical protein
VSTDHHLTPLLRNQFGIMVKPSFFLPLVDRLGWCGSVVSICGISFLLRGN